MWQTLDRMFGSWHVIFGKERENWKAVNGAPILTRQGLIECVLTAMQQWLAPNRIKEAFAEVGWAEVGCVNRDLFKPEDKRFVIDHERKEQVETILLRVCAHVQADAQAAYVEKEAKLKCCEKALAEIVPVAAEAPSAAALQEKYGSIARETLFEMLAQSLSTALQLAEMVREERASTQQISALVRPPFTEKKTEKPGSNRPIRGTSGTVCQPLSKLLEMAEDDEKEDAAKEAAAAEKRAARAQKAQQRSKEAEERVSVKRTLDLLGYTNARDNPSYQKTPVTTYRRFLQDQQGTQPATKSKREHFTQISAMILATLQATESADVALRHKNGTLLSCALLREELSKPVALSEQESMESEDDGEEMREVD